jgi:hypothetical protein
MSDCCLQVIEGGTVTAKFMLGLLTGLCVGAGAVIVYDMTPPITKSEPSYIRELEESLQKNAEKAERQRQCRTMYNDYVTTPLSETAKERNKVLVENCINSHLIHNDFNDGDRVRICLVLGIEKDRLLKIERDKVGVEFRNIGAAGDRLDKTLRLDAANDDLNEGFSTAEITLDCGKRLGRDSK